eukprot:4949154-Alexandrium_andersonii.AAC.1
MTNCHSPRSRAPPRSPTPCSADTWRLKRAHARQVGARPVHSHLLKRREGGTVSGSSNGDLEVSRQEHCANEWCRGSSRLEPKW